MYALYIYVVAVMRFPDASLYGRFSAHALHRLCGAIRILLSAVHSEPLHVHPWRTLMLPKMNLI